jgi:hypothetical protein
VVQQNAHSDDVVQLESSKVSSTVNPPVLFSNKNVYVPSTERIGAISTSTALIAPTKTLQATTQKFIAIESVRE